ncbi:hypothetical protein JHL17_11250 [Azospirillum sp. YIM B02556]|uniref:Uncharacterized protein n=1 Tax=Azospirillum endophyticum TaxID=2800326 RepID=A0ABS1F3J0_9PROT|nr:hypothetical protein [Azospirillum endophyticum]MBK1837989.1 hypothetical protein [Azospirillum endophyticum]
MADAKRSALTDIIISLPVFWRVFVVLFTMIFISVVVTMFVLPASIAITKGRSVSISWSDGLKIPEDPAIKAEIQKVRASIDTSILNFQIQLSESRKLVKDRQDKYAEQTHVDWGKADAIYKPLITQAQVRLDEDEKSMDRRIEALNQFKERVSSWW